MFQKIRNHHTVKRDFEHFADNAGLVYFGTVKKSDEYDTVRGMTFSPDLVDQNVCLGTVGSYDVKVMSREASHRHLADTIATYDWTLLSVRLAQSGFPHVILDARKHDKLFYENVFMRFPRLRRANEVLSNLNPSAANYFDLYIAPESNISLLNMFDDELLERLILNFSHCSVEIRDAELTVFYRGAPSNEQQLKRMLDEALWLAERIEMKNAYSDTAAGILVG